MYATVVDKSGQCYCNNDIVIKPFPLSSKLQVVDTGMVTYDGIVSASLETGVAVPQQMKLLQGLGNLFMAQIVHEHCSSHDKDLCKGTMPFFAAYNTCLTSK